MRGGWVNSFNPVNGEDLGVLDGFSEGAAFMHLAYVDTKAAGFEADYRAAPTPYHDRPLARCDLQYNCAATTFGLPKNRPTAGTMTYDMTWVYSGWDESHAYFPNLSVYKGEDDMRTISESATPAIGAVEYTIDPMPTGQGALLAHETNAITLGRYVQITTNKTVVNGTDTQLTFIVETSTGISGINFSAFPFRAFQDDIISATLSIAHSGNTNGFFNPPITGTLWAEFQRSSAHSPQSYNSGPNDLLEPSLRTSDNGWYNSPVTNVTFNGGTVNVDVTPMLQRYILENGPLPGEPGDGPTGYDGSRLGFVIDTSSTPRTNSAVAPLTGIRLTVVYRPSYKQHAAWVGADGNPLQPSNRKSAQIVYDGANRAVLFGGIDGNTVLGDTHELRIAVDANNYPLATIWNAWPSSVLETAPVPRYGHSMVWDPLLQRVWVFGGFDSEHRPLNDIWYYERGADVDTPGVWTEVKVFADNEKPMPRGGAGMVFFNGQSAAQQDIVLFGGTDGKTYFDDTWVFRRSESRWVLVTPAGERSSGLLGLAPVSPTPRAYPSFTFGSNPFGSPVVQGAFLFGGRGGALPTGKDTDADLVDDAVEFELGGPDAGRDPRYNAAFDPANLSETRPFNAMRLGSLQPIYNALLAPRRAVANMESLSHADRILGVLDNLPYEGSGDGDVLVTDTGVETHYPAATNLWYHRYSFENPFDTRDVWQLGRPDNTVLGSNGAPPYAYSGRWCWGTSLNGAYPNNARMELLSPVFSLNLPPSAEQALSQAYGTSYHLVFHEWVDLHGSGDVIRVEAIRPQTPADMLNRISGVTKAVIKIIPDRNNAANSHGEWRRVIAPLDAIANESNLFLRFSLQTDSNGVAGGWYIDDVAIIQGGEISGYFTNMPFGQVALYGTNYNFHTLSNTLTGADGLFRFGLLPLGNYCYGAGGEVYCGISLASGAPTFDLGLTNISPVVITSIVSNMPTSVSWPTAPGLTYRLEYTTNVLCDPCWTPIETVVAPGTNEVYLDYITDQMRIYRVLQGAGL